MEGQSLKVLTIPQQKGSAADGHQEHLVEIHRNRITQVKGSNPVPIAQGHDDTASVGSISMKPHSMLLTNAVHFHHIINAAVVGGADGGDSAEGNVALCHILLHQLAEGVHIHLLPPVNRNLHHRIIAQAQKMGTLLHGKVGDGGSVYPEFAVVSRQP